MSYSEYDKINGKYAEVELTDIGQKVLFFDGRINHKTIPYGFYVYDIRHNDYDWDISAISVALLPSITSVTVMMIGEIPVISVTLSM